MTISTGLMLPTTLVRAAANDLVLDLREFGGIVQPSAGTITVYDETGTTIVNAQAVTITDDQATYTNAAVTLPVTLPLSDKWRIVWTMTVDSDAVPVNQQAYLVRNELRPVISDVHLYRRQAGLRDLLPADQPSWQDQRDDAWEDIQGMLIEGGKRPYLVLSSWSLKKPHTHLALARIYRMLATFTSGKGKYAEMADYYDEAFASDWAGLTLDYDYDEDGTLTDDEEQVAVDSVIFLNGDVQDRWMGNRFK